MFGTETPLTWIASEQDSTNGWTNFGPFLANGSLDNGTRRTCQKCDNN